MITMLQCRLAKDGSDADLQKEFTDVNNKTDRIKTLLRLGLLAEQKRLLKNTIPYDTAVQDAAPRRRQEAVARIGTEVIRVVLS